jgi:hypothetical protein
MPGGSSRIYERFFEQRVFDFTSGQSSLVYCHQQRSLLKPNALPYSLHHFLSAVEHLSRVVVGSDVVLHVSVLQIYPQTKKIADPLMGMESMARLVLEQQSRGQSSLLEGRILQQQGVGESSKATQHLKKPRITSSEVKHLLQAAVLKDRKKSASVYYVCSIRLENQLTVDCGSSILAFVDTSATQTIEPVSTLWLEATEQLGPGQATARMRSLLMQSLRGVLEMAHLSWEQMRNILCLAWVDNHFRQYDQLRRVLRAFQQPAGFAVGDSDFSLQQSAESHGTHSSYLNHSARTNSAYENENEEEEEEEVLGELFLEHDESSSPPRLMARSPPTTGYAKPPIPMEREKGREKEQKQKHGKEKEKEKEEGKAARAPALAHMIRPRPEDRSYLRPQGSWADDLHPAEAADIPPPFSTGTSRSHSRIASAQSSRQSTPRTSYFDAAEVAPPFSLREVGESLTSDFKHLLADPTDASWKMEVEKAERPFANAIDFSACVTSWRREWAAMRRDVPFDPHAYLHAAEDSTE